MISDEEKRAMKIRAGEDIVRRARHAVETGQCRSFVIYADEADPAVVTSVGLIPNEPD